MRAEFFRRDAPDTVVGTAEWDGHRAVVQADDEQVRKVLEHVFRASSVSIDDPATRPQGTGGPTVAAPGDLEWFRVAAAVRGRQENLGVRFVTEHPGGWDPALEPQTYGWAGRKPALPREG